MSNTPTSIAVLATVNAPYSIQMDSSELAEALKAGDIKKAQVGSFLMEVNSELQFKFAQEYNVSPIKLKNTAKLFAQWSGQKAVL